MRKRLAPILAVAAILAGASFACSRVATAPKGLPGAPTTEVQAREPGAFDVVKMGRFGGRMGPVYFAHELHADLPGLDGKIISCSTCHNEACGSPRRCGECHVPARRGSGAKLPST